MNRPRSVAQTASLPDRRLPICDRADRRSAIQQVWQPALRAGSWGEGGRFRAGQTGELFSHFCARCIPKVSVAAHPTECGSPEPQQLLWLGRVGIPPCRSPDRHVLRHCRAALRQFRASQREWHSGGGEGELAAAVLPGDAND
jgi:hypothetical protein